jgi:RimJ/RimL family protein N-acetyltransferase
MRPLESIDETLYCGLYTDEQTMRFIGKPLTWKRAASNFRKVIRSSKEGPPEGLFLTIVEKSTQCPAGICAIVQFDASRTSAEAGVMLLPEARSKGLSKECLSGLVDRAFSMFPIDEVWVQYSLGHSAAEHLVISVGFSPRVDPEESDGSPAKRVWSVRRPSWGSINAANNQGIDQCQT